jgi:hypothetical protein
MMNTKSNLTKNNASHIIKLNKLLDNRGVNLLNGEYDPDYVLELKVIYKIIKKIINDNIYKLNPIEITKNKLIKIRPINVVDYLITYPEVYSDKAFIISVDKKLNRKFINDLINITYETNFYYKNNRYNILNNFKIDVKRLNKKVSELPYNDEYIKYLSYDENNIHLYITLKKYY